MWVPITQQELRELGTRIVCRCVWADSEPELYGKLHESYPREEWVLLRAPSWCGDKLVAVVVQPRVE